MSRTKPFLADLSDGLGKRGERAIRIARQLSQRLHQEPSAR